MTTLHVLALFTAQTVTQLFELGLSVARIAGLPVTSWQTGDPTRSLYMYLAEVLAALEVNAAEFAKSGFLSTATGDWLTVLAREVFNIERAEGGYATPSVTLVNTGGGLYEYGAGDVTVRSSVNGKTYHNTSEGTLASGVGETLTLDFEADEIGSDSTIAEDEIDEIVTGGTEVDIQSNTASVGTDAQSDESLREQCIATTGALSPNGPADAYEYVVRNSDLTGNTEITRAQADHDNTDGIVTVYVAGVDGAVSAEALTAANDAIHLWATPLTVTSSVVNATPLEQDLEAEVSAEGLPTGWEDAGEDALRVLFANVAIGGQLSRSAIISNLQTTLAALGATDISIELITPAADLAADTGEMLTVGTVTLTEV